MEFDLFFCVANQNANNNFNDTMKEETEEPNMNYIELWEKWCSFPTMPQVLLSCPWF